MASGDTKTEAMLNVLGNGGTGDEFRGCCNTKTQSYILDAIDRINALQPGGSSNFNDLENRPSYNGVAMTGSTNIPEVKTYSNFIGTDGQTAGSAGLVPAPATTDAGKFLKADGTWSTAGGGGPTVVQTAGTSQTDVMSQNAVTSMVYKDPGTCSQIHLTNTTANMGDSGIVLGWNSTGTGNKAVAIGATATCSGGTSVAIGRSCTASANSTVAIGSSANATKGEATAIGCTAHANGASSLALGAYSTTSSIGAISFPYCNDGGAQGVVNFGPYNASYGYNNTNYRLITGVHDAQNAHDAVTLGQLSQLLTALNSALGTSITITGGVISNSNANNNSGVGDEDPSDPSANPGGEEPAPEDAEAPGP